MIPRPLHIAFLGPSRTWRRPFSWSRALRRRNPCDLDRRRRVAVWGGPSITSPTTSSSQRHFSLEAQVWQIPSSVYRMMAVSYAELVERVYDKGAIGKYLVDQLIDWNLRAHSRPIEYRSLGDTLRFRDHESKRRAMGVAAGATVQLADAYTHPGLHRPIRVYEWIDSVSSSRTSSPRSRALPAVFRNREVHLTARA